MRGQTSEATPVRPPPTAPEPRDGKGTRAARGLVAVMAALVILPPLVQAGLELARDRRVEALELFRTPPTRGALRAFEDDLERASWLVRAARRDYARWLDDRVGRGNRRVTIGRDGWLFLREAVGYVAAPPFDTPRARRVLELQAGQGGDPLAAVLDFEGQLAARGIELLVVPVPVKATIYPEKLWRGATLEAWRGDRAGPPPRRQPPPNNPAFARFVRRLEARGVLVVDLAPRLLAAKQAGRRVYLERDTHWSPEGAQIAARGVARKVSELGLLPEPPPNRVFDQRLVHFEGRGDLAAMLGYERQAPGDLLRFAVRQVISLPDGSGPFDRRSPVLLLGDSLTNVFSDERLAMGRRGGFGERLARELRRPIDIIASPAGGATGSRRSLALQPERLLGKKLVVWQFTQRDLLFARDGWQPVELPPAPRDEAALAERRGPVTTLARVVGVTRMPENNDYEECLIIVKYQQLAGELGHGLKRNFFVAYWGWADWRPTPEARIRVDEVHSLELVPLAERLDLESTCWVDTVGLNQEPWWAMARQR